MSCVDFGSFSYFFHVLSHTALASVSAILYLADLSIEKSVLLIRVPRVIVPVDVTLPVDVDPVLVDEGFVLENITFPFQLHVSVVYCELVSYFFHVELHVSTAPDSDVFACVCVPQ